MSLIARVLAFINAVGADIKHLNTNKQNKITSGTAEPTGGNDGDIYIKY